MTRILLTCVLAAAFLTSARGDETSTADKSHYTLFNPTPCDSLRVWRTDHAGVVPYTIDAGHVEVDITLVSYAYDEFDSPLSLFGSSGPKFSTDAWAYGATLIKLGLLNRLDAEVALVPYETVTTGPKTHFILNTGAFVHRETVSGFGDIVSRLKFNVWGNDEGRTALSISGIVKFPTASHELGNGQFEGGPALEFAGQLPWGFELRVDSAVNFFEDDHNRQASFNNLLSVSHQIIGNLEGYAMFNTFAFTTGDDWAGSLQAGFNYRILKNVELYVGNSFGVTDTAFDYEPFVGVAARF